MSEKVPGREHVEHIGWQDLDKWKYYTIGPTLFFCTRLLIFPPLLIRTRLQVQNQHSVYNGTFDAFRKIFKVEGIRGFYKGFATSTLTILTGQIYLSTFEIIRANISISKEIGKNLIAGMCSSFAVQTLTVPIDIVSQKQMMAGQNITGSKHRSAWSVVLEISKTDGLKGFFRGYMASVLTYAPTSGIWWGSYYAFNQFFCNFRPDGTPDIFIQGVSGPAASAIAVTCTNPIDVIRTRLQVRGGKETFSSTFISLYQEEGIRGSFKGLTARLTASIPSGFILIVTYEIIKKLSKKSEEHSEK